MATNELRDQVLRKATDLIQHNRDLKEQMALMNEAVDELESQRNELYRMLARSQMALASTGKLEPDSSSILSAVSGDCVESNPGDSWLRKGWLSTSKLRKDLGSIEDFWMKSRTQDALNDLDKLLFREDIGPDVRVNAKLLKSCIFRDAGQATRALTQANEALDIAKRYDVFYSLRGKARFHVGMCQYEASKFIEAVWSFSLASHTKGHANEVEVWKNLAQEELEKGGMKALSLDR